MRLVVTELRDTRPSSFSGSSHVPCRNQFGSQSNNILEDFVELVNFRITRKQSSTGGHLGKYTTSRPNVHRDRVRLRTQEDFRSTIPQGDDFMGVRTDWNTKGSGKSKVSKFQAPVRVNQKILWLKITMDDTARMAEEQTFQQLLGVALLVLNLSQFHPTFTTLVGRGPLTLSM